MTVQTLNDIDLNRLALLLQGYRLQMHCVADGAPIPGTFWGEPEAGLIGDTLYVRRDTPVHSALHEAGHWICMDDVRRARLHTNAGGTVEEECAVNYLQILLADALADVGRERMLEDMNTWGYSYREGDVRAWLAGDAVDAKSWLLEHGLIDEHGHLIKQP